MFYLSSKESTIRARAAGLRSSRLPLPKGAPLKGSLAEGQPMEENEELLLPSVSQSGVDGRRS